ncbi:sensor histidine kinase [Geopsychrobacter electrodiphilus]|uniref:sensor histidine kinase n=1 Tax=Geopsychrobacter electrodiphilus TaxID=225196 RepID=UPI0009FE6815|nr:ATP-binding protein [Geopsychrobacter electrodiphilus]
MELISRRIAQLTLLSRLGQAINAATDLTSLCEIIPTVFVEHAALTGVILRPKLSDPISEKPYFLRTQITDSAQLLFLLQQEQQISDQVQRTGRSQNLTPIGPQKDLPSCLYCVPLSIHGRHLGTLSFFGGSDDNRAPFRLEQQQLFLTCSFQIAQALEQQLTTERLRRVSAADARNLQDISLLYRISQLLHSTLATDELMHLILSLLVHPQGGAFQRAMLFMVNERSNSLQGILGVTRETSELVLPEGLPVENNPLQIAAEVLSAQKNTDFSQRIMQLRLPLDDPDSCLARVVRGQQAVKIERPHKSDDMAPTLSLQDHACIPLIARQRVLCVLAVDNYDTMEKIDAQRMLFLELFAAQAGIALDNAQLVSRLESAHRSLHETQERLLHREKMATIGEMSASIAHELRNPLASVGGFARRLRKKLPADSSELNYAIIIQEESERLEKMLDKILSFARQDEMTPALFRLERILEQSLLIESEKLTQANIKLTTEFAADLPPLQGDAEQIEQVLINLIGNARQAMPQGGQLSIRARKTRIRGEDAIQLEIHDTGEGIPPEVMANIFNPFFTTRKQGTGLGLSICQRIIDHHQGELKAVNHQNGACFTLTLPLRLKGRSFKNPDADN